MKMMNPQVDDIEEDNDAYHSDDSSDGDGETPVVDFVMDTSSPLTPESQLSAMSSGDEPFTSAHDRSGATPPTVSFSSPLTPMSPLSAASPVLAPLVPLADVARLPPPTFSPTPAPLHSPTRLWTQEPEMDTNMDGEADGYTSSSESTGSPLAEMSSPLSAMDVGWGSSDYDPMDTSPGLHTARPSPHSSAAPTALPTPISGGGPSTATPTREPYASRPSLLRKYGNPNVLRTQLKHGVATNACSDGWQGMVPHPKARSTSYLKTLDGLVAKGFKLIKHDGS